MSQKERLKTTERLRKVGEVGMRCPCKGCDRRKLGCHGRCEQYKAWTASRHEINRKRYAEQDVRQLSRDHERKYRRNLKQGFQNK